MKAEVTIAISSAFNVVTVENDKGAKWRFQLHKPELDVTIAGALANIAASQLAATITAQLLATNAKRLKYKLELLTGADAC